ncbi:MAG: hypothetical protein IMX01_07115 [Limnochordaceae bacterium]|nr:hypothetical protein [Limnochordaceae bacterium]
MSDPTSLAQALGIDRPLLDAMLADLVRRRWLAETVEGGGTNARVLPGCAGCPLSAGAARERALGAFSSSQARRYLLTPAGRRMLDRSRSR